MTVSSNISELYKTEVYLFLYPEDGCKRLFRNIGMYVCMYQTAVGHIPKVRNFYVPRRDHSNPTMMLVCIETLTVRNHTPVCVRYIPVYKLPPVQ
jgi:hypothetical protein